MKVTYEFADGSRSEVELDGSLAEEIAKILAEEHRIERKETRRHFSLEGLAEAGIHLAARDSDPYELLLNNDHERGNFSILPDLSLKQKIVVKKHYIEGYSVLEIAKGLGISESAVRQRLDSAKKKLTNRLSGK